MSFLADNFDLLRDAFLTTLSLAVLSGIFALVLGTLLTAMRVSPVKPLRAAATFYVEVFRNTPLTVVFCGPASTRCRRVRRRRPGRSGWTSARP
jgi:glutamate transport system permease protein